MAIARARAGAAGNEGLLLSAPLPPLPTAALADSDSKGGRSEMLPLAFLATSVLSKVRSMPWLGKDVVLVLLDDDVDISGDVEEGAANATRGRDGTSAALRAWLQSAYFDPEAELVSEATQGAIQAGNWLQWLRLTLGSGNGSGKGSAQAWHEWSSQRASLATMPLKHSIPPLRLCLSLTYPVGDAPSLVPFVPSGGTAVLIHGSGGQLPELDALTVGIKALTSDSITVHADAAPDSVHARLERLFKRLRKQLRTHRGAVEDLLRPVAAAATIASNALGGGKAIELGVEQADVWLSRLHDLFRFSAQMLVEGSGPHADLLPRGLQAISWQPQRAAGSSAGSGGIDANFYSERLGRSIEKWLRTGCGLDERLHASMPFYLSMGLDHFVGLSEYVMPALCFHVPILLVAFSHTPARMPLLLALLEALVCFAVGAYTYLAWLTNADSGPQWLWIAKACAVEAATLFLVLPYMRAAFKAMVVTHEKAIDFKEAGQRKRDDAVAAAQDAASGTTAGSARPAAAAAEAEKAAAEAQRLQRHQASADDSVGHFLSMLAVGYAQFPLLYSHTVLHFAIAILYIPTMLVLLWLRKRWSFAAASPHPSSLRLWIVRAVYWIIWEATCPLFVPFLLAYLVGLGSSAAPLNASDASAVADAVAGPWSQMRLTLQQQRIDASINSYQVPLVLLTIVFPAHRMFALPRYNGMSMHQL
jgi:hypothetical protein